jgi:hypothetical protein
MAEEESGFKISDRRRVSEEGGTRAGQPSAPESPKLEEAKSPPQEPQEEAKDPFAPLSEITFASFIFSLGHSAFIHLGEEPDPISGTTRVSLPLAKETIDILTILEEKTRGNLSPDEGHLMQNLLYALRIKYVEKVTRQ